MAEPETPELARAAVDGGADVVEIGFPFSDPLADGPVIRRAAERALSRGMRTRQCLDVLARTRERAARDAAHPDDVRVAARGVRLGALRHGRRRRRRDEPDHRRPPRGRPAGASARPARRSDLDRRSGSGSRASRPTAGSTSSRWRGRPERATTSPPPSPVSPSAPGPRPTSRSTPASASRPRSTRAPRPSSRTESSSARRALLAAEDGADALRDYVASLRAALDT